MTSALPQHVVRLSDAAGRKDIHFRIAPDPQQLTALASDLGIVSVRKLRFDGRLIPLGRTDWRLEAQLGATVVQDCVVTLAPVTTRIDEEVRRTYVADLPVPAPGEVEMPEDDSIDPLPQALDLAEVMAEALALALPPFPRAEGAALGEVVVTGPGADPMTAEKAKPFSGLGDLKKALEKKADPSD